MPVVGPERNTRQRKWITTLAQTPLGRSSSPCTIMIFNVARTLGVLTTLASALHNSVWTRLSVAFGADGLVRIVSFRCPAWSISHERFHGRDMRLPTADNATPGNNAMGRASVAG
ncbi:MAG: hypothetical protein Q9204_004762 [Flavoplaca sp. TL-2023a]